MWSWLLGGGPSPPSSSASARTSTATPPPSTSTPTPTPTRSRLASFLLGASGHSSSSSAAAAARGPREFTLAGLQRLHVELERALTHALPDADVVELLRVLSEFLIYSDQHRAASPPALGEAPAAGDAGVFFDYFCEKNMLGLLVALGAAPPSAAVQIQLLQTLSLLVQNIATRTSLFYLLSNNHVNRLLECPFAVERDDDVRDWFVTLLKALSLRLTSETVQFFVDADSRAFPLYEQALRFGRCGETMIKVAVKTLMLNVLRVPDERVRRFVLAHRDMAYFRDVVDHANELALKLQGLLNIWTPTATAVGEKLEEAVDEYLDHCFFLQDVLEVNVPELCYRVGGWLFTKHVKELLAVSLLPNCCPPPQRVSTKLALYLLTRLLGTLEHAPLVNAIAFLLLSPDAHERCDYSSVALGGGARRRSLRPARASTADAAKPLPARRKSKSKSKSQSQSQRRKLVFRAHADGDCNSPVCYLQTRFSHGEWPVDEVERFRSDGSSCFRQSLLALLESADEALASAAMLVVIAVMENEAVDRSLLRDLGLLPWRLRHHHHHHKPLALALALAPASADTTADATAADDAGSGPSPPHEGDAESSSLSSSSETSLAEEDADADADTQRSTASAEAPRPEATGLWLVDPVLRVLQRCCDARLLCSQLATRLLLDLAWDPEAPDVDGGDSGGAGALSAAQLATLGDIHSSSTHQVMQSMRGAMADVDLFIYVLEDEVAEFSRAPFPPRVQLKAASPYEFLVPLASPGQSSAELKASLALRSPLNEMEACRKSMRVFLTLRRLRGAVDARYRDDHLTAFAAFRHPHTTALAAATPSRAASDPAARVALDGMVGLRCGWREQRFLASPARLLLLLNPEALVLVERDGGPDAAFGFVRLFAPIHRTYASVDAKDALVLHVSVSSAVAVEGCRGYVKTGPRDQVASELKSWHASVLFEAADDAQQAKAHIDLCRAEVRAFKLLQVEQSLSAHVRDPHSHGARDSELSEAPATGDEQPQDEQDA
ncbi:hypothetical protein P43SY_006048 [Pythium insidiosum]|uniref:FPL domain-containing protein n=1 Tax=Pythium insidiosum TaxID=114742 RepID=A0AAD5LE57_PYTIN|nr:hypothetical protein P43SY_006048 [Pythium insidiosum]